MTQEHPWVTCRGEDQLLSVEENTADFITLTEEEMASAISKSIHNAMAVVRNDPSTKISRRSNLTRCELSAS